MLRGPFESQKKEGNLLYLVWFSVVCKRPSARPAAPSGPMRAAVADTPTPSKVSWWLVSRDYLKVLSNEN
jgi:hypothetical protein